MHPPMIENLKKDLTIVVFCPEEKDISKPFWIIRNINSYSIA